MNCRTCEKELTQNDPMVIRYVKKIGKNKEYFSGQCRDCANDTCLIRYWKRQGVEALRKTIKTMKERAQWLQRLLNKMEKNK
jgi:phosphoribulokinase